MATNNEHSILLERVLGEVAETRRQALMALPKAFAVSLEFLERWEELQQVMGGAADLVSDRAAAFRAAKEAAVEAWKEAACLLLAAAARILAGNKELAEVPGHLMQGPMMRVIVRGQEESLTAIAHAATEAAWRLVEARNDPGEVATAGAAAWATAMLAIALFAPSQLCPWTGGNQSPSHTEMLQLLAKLE